MILAELLNRTNFKSEVTADTPVSYAVKTTLDSGKVIKFHAFIMDNHETDHHGDQWSIEFAEPHMSSKFGGKPQLVHAYHTTGSGQSLATFAFVKKCLLELIKKHHPNVMICSGADDRVQLYKKLLSTVPGYTFKFGSRQDDEEYGDTVMRLIKNGYTPGK